MSHHFDTAFTHTLGLEGKYSNNPADAGGETMWGITIAVARENGYQGPMSSMPLSEAKRIYKARYWDELRLDEVATLSPEVALELFDTGVNMGKGKAGEFLQVSLNALNDGGKLFPDVGEDGDIGPRTVGALAAYLRHRGARGETVLLRALNCLQGARYIEISRTRAANEAFVYGWLSNRVGV